MKTSLNENRIPVWLFVAAPLVSMLLPFGLMLVDEYSECHLIPLVNQKEFSAMVFFNLYMGIPLAIVPYGIYLIYKNRHLRQTAANKFYILCAAVLFDLLSPFMLYVWLMIVLVIWIGSGCYKLEMKLY